MNTLKLLFSLTMVLALAACSTQYREADEMATQEELFGEQGLFYEVQSATQGSVIGGLSIESIMNGNSAFLYHARETAGRPAASILSVGDMSALNRAYPSDLPSSQIGLINVDVFFVDSYVSNGTQNGERQFGLAIRIIDASSRGPQDAFYISGSGNQHTFTDKLFEASISMANGSEIIVQSTDISQDYNNELGNAVKLKLYSRTVGSDLRYIGQISTMRGYGNKK